MQIGLFVILLSFGLYPGLALCQDYIALDVLIYLANCKSYNCFDEKIRDHGYTFSEKTISDGNERYIYLKEMETETKILTNTISYTDYGDFKPLIVFGTSVNDIIAAYRKSFSKYGFKPKNCPTKLAEEGIAFCYENNLYGLMLLDVQGNDNGRKYRKYHAKIFKL